MTKNPIAFLSMDNLEGFFTYDTLASKILESRGYPVDYVPWKSKVDWNQYSHVIIRSTWDYQNYVEDFIQVLREIEKSKARLLNPLEIVEWNLNKKYMLELEENDVPIVPTVHGNSIRADDFSDLSEKLHTDEIILKPLFGANADGIFRLQKPFNCEKAKAAEDYYKNQEFFAQPFLPSILNEGEISLFYYLDKYCYAIQKIPKTGDFRVQEEHGGELKTFDADSEMIEIGNKAMSSISGTTIYARVDLVRCPNGKFGVMELELIEPSLYFNMYPEAAGYFVDALEKMMNNSII